jgi:hypothetical protein
MQWLLSSAGGIFQKITTDSAWVYIVGGGWERVNMMGTGIENMDCGLGANWEH